MVKRMQGVPAHIVTFRPDKWIYNNTCRYYLRDKRCGRRPKTECTGATYCIMYEEKPKNSKKKNNPRANTSKEKKKTRVKKIDYRKKIERDKNREISNNKIYKTKLTKGRKLVHKTLGEGSIIDNDGYSIRVDFKGDIKRFKISYMVENKLIKIV